MYNDEDDFKSQDEIQKMPLYQKGWEIMILSKKIAEIIPRDEELIGSYAHYLTVDSGLICAKIAGAEAGDLYDLRMENAAIIRKAARDLLTYTSALKAFGFSEPEYLDLLRNAIEEFRILFAKWVAGFDQWNYIIDRWGLFNPPGINYDDKNDI
ncbi:hypothetical protein [Abyssalbus ytuae]|uniref:Uncharacterized protein n=1 Tax=Abyssalbus ytuae TaxID=2926907 RepID=A0A9E6ZQ84_9FLAO|nr:hypothetical protein [Abyssalbus ytuae]UOB16773.1 hypothetical protein MQE35_13625 [Abyssalbus ytuae]